MVTSTCSQQVARTSPAPMSAPHVAQRCPSYSDLPGHILLQVLSQLPPDAIKQARGVSRDFRDFSSELVTELAPRRMEASLSAKLHSSFPHLAGLDLSLACNRRELTLEQQEHFLLLTGLLSLRLAGVHTLGDASISALAGELPQLLTLDIGDCHKVTDAGLAGIAAGLPRLQRLSVRHCEHITDEGMACLASLTGLQHLDVSHCSRVRNGVSALGSLTRLLSLNMHGSGSHTGAAPTFADVLLNFTQLTRLDLSGVLSKGDVQIAHVASAIHTLSTLRSLDLSHCRLHSDAVTALAANSALEELSLAHSLDVSTPEMMAELLTLRRLTSLDFRGCARYVSGNLLLPWYAEFGTLSQLRVSVQGKVKAAEFLGAKGGLRGLQDLDLTVGCLGLPEASSSAADDGTTIAPVWTMLRGLTLNVERSNRPGGVLKCLAAHMPSLERLAIKQCKALKRGHDWEALHRFTTLKSLHLYKADFGQDDLAYLAPMASLTSLLLEHCPRAVAGPSGLAALLPLAPQLRSLGLAGCNVAGVALVRDLPAFTCLRDLSLAQNRRVDFVSVAAVLPRLPHLYRACVANCGLEKHEEDALAASLPLVDVVRSLCSTEWPAYKRWTDASWNDGRVQFATTVPSLPRPAGAALNVR